MLRQQMSDDGMRLFELAAKLVYLSAAAVGLFLGHLGTFAFEWVISRTPTAPLRCLGFAVIA